MIFAELSHFGLIRFGGADACAFLQGQLSCDVNSLQPASATYGSYNTPQGRMLASFLLWRDATDYYMQLPRQLAEPLRKRLSMYILRSKVVAFDASSDRALLGLAGSGWEEPLQPWFGSLPDAPLSGAQVGALSLLRLSADRFMVMGPHTELQSLALQRAQGATNATREAWNWYDIRDGIPWISQATQDQFVPQMANLDLIGGVSFTKGCYPGQEIVARMHYLGRLKQRLYLANIAAQDAPLPGSKLFSPDLGEQACGTIVNSAPAPRGQDVLAVIQTASVASGPVHYLEPDGPLLAFRDLPYGAPMHS